MRKTVRAGPGEWAPAGVETAHCDESCRKIAKIWRKHFMIGFKQADALSRVVARRFAALAALSVVCVSGSVAAQGTPPCNKVRSWTIAPPDRADASSKVFITVKNSCGGLPKKCQPMIQPLSSWSTADKCNAIANAIATDPQCQANGYVIETNSCTTSSTFVVADPTCPTETLSLGLACDPFIENQTGQGQFICDYEAEIITPGCTNPDGVPGNDDDVVNQVILKGTATAQSIVPGQPPRVRMIFERGSQVRSVEAPTSPGMTAAEVTRSLALAIKQLPDPPPCDPFGGRSIRCTQPLQGAPIGVSVQVNVIGITSGTQVAEVAELPVADGNGCNQVTSQTVLRPDLASPSSKVFINLMNRCNNVVKRCQPSLVPQSSWSTQEKCRALASAIRQDPQCQANGYVISSDDCAQSSTFTVADPTCPSSTLSLGISCDPAIFTQTGSGQTPICDYEADVITSGCNNPVGTPVPFDDVLSQVTLRGTATGAPISSGASPGVQLIASINGEPRSIKVPTSSGMPAAEVARRLASQFQDQGLPCSFLAPSSIRCLHTSTSGANLRLGLAVGVNDLGITAGNITGDVTQINGVPVPSSTEWGLMILGGLLVGATAWHLSRREAAVLA
jgi:hypothetical protein